MSNLKPVMSAAEIPEKLIVSELEEGFHSTVQPDFDSEKAKLPMLAKRGV